MTKIWLQKAVTPISRNGVERGGGVRGPSLLFKSLNKGSVVEFTSVEFEPIIVIYYLSICEIC